MLRYIVFCDDGLWIAQGLEFDICAQGESLEEACDRFGATVRAEENDAQAEGKSLQDIGPAPKHFFEKWNQGDDRSKVLEVA